MKVLVRTRENVLFEGDAESVSSVNEDGPFDVLEGHTNFISLINGYLDIKLGSQKRKRIDIENGVIKVVSNNVEVYLGVKEALKNR